MNRAPLCTYRLNWARRNSWGWWDEWDDTVLQTQDSKFEPWRSEAEHATSRSRRLPQYWLSHVDEEETFFVFFQTAETGNRTPDSGVKGSGANHYPRAPALQIKSSATAYMDLWDHIHFIKFVSIWLFHQNDCVSKKAFRSLTCCSCHTCTIKEICSHAPEISTAI